MTFTLRLRSLLRFVLIYLLACVVPLAAIFLLPAALSPHHFSPRFIQGFLWFLSWGIWISVLLLVPPIMSALHLYFQDRLDLIPRFQGTRGGVFLGLIEGGTTFLIVFMGWFVLLQPNLRDEMEGLRWVLLTFLLAGPTFVLAARRYPAPSPSQE